MSYLWCDYQRLYVYPYFNGKKIPDVMSVSYSKNIGIVDVEITALPDKFPSWFRSLDDIGSLSLKMDKVGIKLLEFTDADYEVVDIKSAVDDFTVITLRFYLD